MSEPLRALARTRWRVAIGLTALMMLIYFGFILLVAFDPALMARLLVPGLSLGIAVGALVIVAAWILTLGYVVWANRRYDPELARLRKEAER
ncbi:MAG: DUF485 domain-containing protein [Gemmatimonadales bacterium]|nr:DUF485 domain-containing protein [Gemmatimonadales bacterium]